MRITKRKTGSAVRPTSNNCHCTFSSTIQLWNCTRVLFYMGISTLFSNKQHVVVHDFTEFSINAKHFQLFDGKSEKPRLFCGPAKNLRGPAQVRGPAVENH